MYRAYPAPSQPLPQSGNNGSNKKDGGPPLPAGSINASASIPKFGSPSLPPPSKKHRAIPLPQTSFVDDKIALRRAQLRNLKVQSANSNAPSILARARAVTSTSTSTSTAAAPTNTGSYLGKPLVTTRSRPMSSVPSPRSPPKFVPMNHVRSKLVGAPVQAPVPVPPRAATFMPVASKIHGGPGVNGNSHNPSGSAANGISPNPVVVSSPPRPISSRLPKGEEVPAKSSAPVEAVEAPVVVQSYQSLLPTSKPPTAMLNDLHPHYSPIIPPAPLKVGASQQVETKVDMPPPVIKTIPVTKTIQIETKVVMPPVTKTIQIETKVIVPPVIKPIQDETKVDMPPVIKTIQVETEAKVQEAAPVAPDKVIVADVPALEPEVTSTKRQTLASLRNAADSPEPKGAADNSGANQNMPELENACPEKQSGTLRLVKELRKAKEKQEEAMKRMAKLESEVMELRLQRESADNRQPRSIRQTSSPRRRRMKSPEPSSRNRPNSNPLADNDIASRAVETVEDVFTSNLATYTARKPYGGNERMDYTFSEEDLVGGMGYPVSWAESVQSYLQSATVKDEKTLEVLAKLEADGSILLIYGTSCRHGVPTIGDNDITGYEFKSFDDVEYMDGSLGKIIYIDAEGNDGEYWLDPVYEEAMKIRESYCSNVFSAALALKEVKASSPQPSMSPKENVDRSNGFGHYPVASPMAMSPPVTPMAMSPPVAPKIHVADACVGTEDLPQVHVAAMPVEKPKEGAARSANGISEKPLPPAPESKKQQNAQEQDSGSTDALSSFIIYFFSSIFSLVWFVVMIPVRVTRFAISAGLVIGIANLLWLYLADNRAAMDMGAIIDKQYNIN